MSDLTTIGLAELWARAFVADRFIRDYAQRHFSREFAVSVGADLGNLPSADDAPFLAIFPDASQSGPQRKNRTHDLGIVAGIKDEDWIGEGGVKTMRGLVRLDELCPMIERAMRDALPAARVQDVETEFEIAAFPLFLANISVTVEESLPVGRRG